MDIQTVIKDADLMATGKARTLATSSPRYTKYLALANMIQRTLLEEPDVQWDWTYSQLSLGTISSDRVDMDDEVYDIHLDQEDPVVIVLPDSNQLSYWPIVQPDELRYYRYGRVCALIGTELVFSKTFVAGDPEYNGEVIAPVHITPDDFLNSTDEVTVPSKAYLATMMAAEYVRNTVTKQNQYSNLVASASNLLTKMKQKNTGSVATARMYPSVLGESYLGNYPYQYSNTAGQPLGDD
jgi:hypothetical protein